MLATQNPIESEGVYPLPEAQRDRFLMKIVVGYPDAAEEVEIVRRMGVDAARAPHEVLDADELRRAAASTPTRSSSTTRSSTTRCAWCSPPAAGRTFGLPEHRPAHRARRQPARQPRPGRRRPRPRADPRPHYVLPQDVFDVAPDVLRHRLVLSYEALADGVTADHSWPRPRTVPAPAVAPSQDGRRSHDGEAMA